MSTKTIEKPKAETNGDQVPAAPLATLSKSIRDSMATIKSIASQYSVSALVACDPFEQAIMMGEGMKALQSAMTKEILDRITSVKGSPLGFLTDEAGRDKPYPIEVIRDCVIEALLRGFRPVGNEFNIIAGRFYGAQNGYVRLVCNLEGVTDVVEAPGVPTIGQGRAAVPYVLSCKFNGETVRIERIVTPQMDGRIMVKINSGMGDDGALGKAKRKIYKAMYDRLTNSQFTAADADLDDRPQVTSGAAPQSLADKLSQHPAAVGTVSPGEVVTPEGEVVATGTDLFPGKSDGPHATNA